MRHGDCAPPEGVCVGQWDLPLSAAGAGQVLRIAADWRGAAPPLIVASDLLRARQTAAVLAACWGVPVVCDARLREIHLGRWQGLAWDDIRRHAPVTLARWGRHWPEQGPPGGESARELLARLAQWWRESQPALPPDALVVAHAGSLRALLCHLARQPAAALFDRAVDCAAPFCLRC